MKVRVRLQQHVALVDSGPAADRRAVNAKAFFKGRFRQLRDGIRNVMPQTWDIGEAQVEDLGVVIPGELENGIGVGHDDSLREGRTSQNRTNGCEASCRRAGCYNRSRCAGPKSLKPVAGAGNSIVLIARDNATLY